MYLTVQNKKMGVWIRTIFDLIDAHISRRLIHMWNKKIKRILYISGIGFLLCNTMVQAEETSSFFEDFSKSLIRNIYDVEMDSENYNLTEETYPDGSIDAIFSYEDEKTSYQVSYDTSNEDFLSLTYQQENIDFEEKAFSYDHEQIIEKYPEAQEIYYAIYGQDADFISSAYQCNLTSDNEIAHGNVNFFFEKSNGDALKILYNVENDVFWNIVVIQRYDDYLREVEDTSANGKDDIERFFYDFSE